MIATPLLTYREQPKGLWVLAFTTMFFSYAFGSINASLVLFLTAQWQMDMQQAITLSATYNALIFTCPLLGGYLAERCGYRYTVLLGMLLSISGLSLFALSVYFILPSIFFLSLATYILGVSAYLPSYLAMQDKLFAKQDIRRDSAFTLSYLISNAGFFLAGIGSTLWLSYNHFFANALTALLAGIGACAIFHFGKGPVIAHRTRRFARQQKNAFQISISIIVIAIAAINWLLQHSVLNRDLMLAIVGMITLWVLSLAYRRRNTRQGGYKLLILLILLYLSIGFWIPYTLEPSLFIVFAHDKVNVIGSAAICYALAPLFILLLGLPISALWHGLAKYGKNPPAVIKLTVATFCMAIGCGILVLGLDKTHHLMNMSWLIIAFAFFALAELCCNPIGQSMIGQLAPEGSEARMVGVWHLFAGFAASLAAPAVELARKTGVPHDAASTQNFHGIFSHFSEWLLVFGVVSALLIPFVLGLMKKSQFHYAVRRHKKYLDRQLEK